MEVGRQDFRWTLIVALLALVVLACGCSSGSSKEGHSSTSAASVPSSSLTQTGAPVPPIAAATVHDLGSASASVQRSVLTPQASALLSAGSLFPPGTHMTVKPNSWHVTGRFANVLAYLVQPGRAPALYEIGLMRPTNRWLVTYAVPAEP